MQTPCKECARRGCGAYHDRCPLFMEWKEKRAAMRKTEETEASLARFFAHHRQKAFIGRFKARGRKNG